MRVMLEATGHRVFVASTSIAPGARWEAAIEAVLTGCDLLLVMWTRHAAESVWVKREVETALRHNRPIVPARLDATPLAWALGEI